MVPDLRIVSEGILTGADGSIINIKMILLGYTFTQDDKIKFEGRWVVVGGTGQYADSSLKGEGTVTVIIETTCNYVTLEGSVKLKT